MTIDSWTDPLHVARRYGIGGEWQRGAPEGVPSIHSYRRPDRDWYAHVLDKLDWTGARSVLDAGCGHGAYLPYLVQRVAQGGRVVGLDFGAGTLAAARLAGSDAELVRGDVQALPLAEDSVDLVISAHMLYHVPDIRQAIREFRRVVRSGGVLAIIIDGERDSAELTDLFLNAGGAHRFADVTDRFHADNARDYLDGIFDEIADLVEEPELVITEARSLVASFDSLRSAVEPALRPGLGWDEFLEAIERRAGETIERDGAFVVREEKHLLVCR